jgi:hypothetical protein
VAAFVGRLLTVLLCLGSVLQGVPPVTRLTVTQKQGVHVLRGVPGMDTLGPGQSLPQGASLFVRDESGLELRLPTGEILRLGALTNVELKQPRALWLHKGALLLALPEGSEAFQVSSPLSDLKLLGQGAVMLGVTQSGGLKVVGIHGAMTLELKDERIKVGAGELVFAFTGGSGFSRKVDVELATIVQTATLIRDFEQPLPFLDEMMKAAQRQNRRIRDRYRALVGDAKTDQEFELKIIKEE